MVSARAFARPLFGVLLVFSAAAVAQSEGSPPDVASLAVSTPGQPRGGPVPAAAARIQVLPRPTAPPLAAVAGNKRTGFTLTGDQQRSYLQQLSQKQAQFMAQVS